MQIYWGSVLQVLNIWQTDQSMIGHLEMLKVQIFRECWSSLKLKLPHSERGTKQGTWNLLEPKNELATQSKLNFKNISLTSYKRRTTFRFFFRAMGALVRGCVAACSCERKSVRASARERLWVESYFSLFLQVLVLLGFLLSLSLSLTHTDTHFISLSHSLPHYCLRLALEDPRTDFDVLVVRPTQIEDLSPSSKSWKFENEPRQQQQQVSSRGKEHPRDSGNWIVQKKKKKNKGQRKNPPEPVDQKRDCWFVRQLWKCRSHRFLLPSARPARPMSTLQSK